MGVCSLSLQVTAIQHAIKQYDENVSRISDLQIRSLRAWDETTSLQNQAQIDDLTAETRTLGNSLRVRIQNLAIWPAKGRDVVIRKNQVCRNSCAIRSCH